MKNKKVKCPECKSKDITQINKGNYVTEIGCFVLVIFVASFLIYQGILVLPIIFGVLAVSGMIISIVQLCRKEYICDDCSTIFRLRNCTSIV